MTQDPIKAITPITEAFYDEQAARTIPDPFGHPDTIPTDGFRDALYKVSEAGKLMDLFKKALVYGREVSAEHAGRPEVNAVEKFSELSAAVPIEVIHGIIGTITEACELADLLITTIYGADNFDELNLLEEFGDLDWYRFRVFRRMGWHPGQSRAANIAKLALRHGLQGTSGTSFNPDAVDHSKRNLAGEREALVQGYEEPGKPGEEIIPASLRMLEHAIEHSVNFHSYDAKLDMPDYAVAAKLAPEAFKWLKGETDVQVFENMSPEERAKIGTE